MTQAKGYPPAFSNVLSNADFAAAVEAAVDAAIMKGGNGLKGMSEAIDNLKKAIDNLKIAGFKIIENPNVQEGTLYAIGKNVAVLGTMPKEKFAESIGKPAEPATMQMSPKKGLNMAEVINKLAIYRFGAVNDPVDEASAKEILGGKGANLAAMARMGFHVPPGFTIPCDISVIYTNGHSPDFKAGVMQTVMDNVIEGDKYLKEQFGYYPLVSVRSGARVSMPGMMDTILNVGIGDWNIMEWINRIGEPAALDSYRRFLQMYGATAMGIPKEAFEAQLADIKAAAKVSKDSDLLPGYLNRLIKRYKDIYTEYGKKVPTLREEALKYAIIAVFESWNNERAIEYRKHEGIPDDWGTAVNIQAMVFGNVNDNSCSGVAFTRDKATGERKATGDFIVNAQGEDVVAAGAPTQPLAEMEKWNKKCFIQLHGVMASLEKHYRDMQDVEFTVQDGTLYMLQTRTGKRSAAAAFQIAHDMVAEGLIDKDTAMKRVGREQLLTIMKPSIDPKFKGKPIATGLGVGGTVVTGVVCLTKDGAKKAKEQGLDAILVRYETNPDDFDGIIAAVGVLTATGGTTSHAAVVANGFDKTCVVGCAKLSFEGKRVGYGKGYFEAGDVISIDGMTGNVYKGEVPVIEPKITTEVQSVAQWFMDAETAYRVTPATVDELKLALLDAPECDTAHVDTCMLAMDADLQSVYGAINHCKAKRVVFDLSDVDGHYGVHDKVINKMFGWNPTLGTGNKRAMAILGMPTEAAMKCVLKLPQSCTMGDKLRKAGFKVVGAVKTVADLLNTDDAVVVDDETIASVFGSKEALEWVQAAMVKSGKTPSKPLPKPVYWYESLMRKGA